MLMWKYNERDFLTSKGIAEKKEKDKRNTNQITTWINRSKDAINNERKKKERKIRRKKKQNKREKRQTLSDNKRRNE